MFVRLTDDCLDHSRADVCHSLQWKMIFVSSCSMLDCFESYSSFIIDIPLRMFEQVQGNHNSIILLH